MSTGYGVLIPPVRKLLTAVPLDPSNILDSACQVAPVGNYLLQWGPLVTAHGADPSHPYRLLSFDPSSPTPIGATPVIGGGPSPSSSGSGRTLAIRAATRAASATAPIWRCFPVETLSSMSFRRRGGARFICGTSIPARRIHCLTSAPWGRSPRSSWAMN